ncbi:pleckstrin homology domain-containing family A member 3-like [Rhinatrema bivittatum]|uniref:pleckstrin homology domain-containing family A member 3-like n=1 Tax=Rhinatrema bivittatum TaxID=194408 RepID=UPI0011263DC3|nr:pleckstrin homology domain-containing family A member 3-like [Rhinatrema bivittatum]
MEGALLKWTNYLSGWQLRYFVLESGILSYYDSRQDVGKGSKGSMKMAVCEIKVHPSDDTRMELVIPGEQLYLRTRDAAERQKWLVALGSAKACLGDSQAQKEKEIVLGRESVSRKISELRLYCDLLTRQVFDVQEAACPREDGSLSDIEKMSNASSLLQTTCSQFLSTLDECMKVASAQLAPSLHQPSPAPSTPDLVGAKLSRAHRVKHSLSHPGAMTSDRNQEPICPPVAQQKGSVTVLRNLEELVKFRSEKWYLQKEAGTQNADSTKDKDVLLPAQALSVKTMSHEEQK